MDTKTALIIAVVTQTSLALGMLLALTTHRVYAGFRYWTWFFFATPICFYLISLRGIAPDFITIVIGNTLAPLSVASLHEGTHRFLSIEGREPWKVNVPVSILAMAGFAWFTYAVNNPSARIFISCAAIALVCFHAAIAPMVFKRGRSTPALNLLTVSLVAYGAFALFRGVRALVLNVPDLMREGWTFNTFLLLLIALSVVNMMGCLLMTHERSLDEGREARRALETLVSNLRGVVYRVRVEENETIEYVSEGVEAMSGYPREKFTGMPIGVFRELMNQEDRAANQEAVQRALAEGRHYAITYRGLDAKGRLLWLWDQGIGVKSADGSCTYREGFITDITERVESEAEKARLVEELKLALSDVKALTGLIPICMSCKKIRDDKGYWNILEQYFKDHTDADFTHGICPECADRLYPLK